MKYRHHKHPDRRYTVIGTGIVSAITSGPINDMDLVKLYADEFGDLFVCRHIDRHPEGYQIVCSEAWAQAREPLTQGAAITLYRCDADATHWVRRTAEFNDGRFTKVEEER